MAGGFADRGALDKIEQILAAEDDARRIVTEAGESGTLLRRDAAVEARRLVDAARAEATKQAADVRAAILASAEVEAARIRETAAAEQEAAAAAASARLEATADHLAARLKG